MTSVAAPAERVPPVDGKMHHDKLVVFDSPGCSVCISGQPEDGPIFAYKSSGQYDHEVQAKSSATHVSSKVDAVMITAFRQGYAIGGSC